LCLGVFKQDFFNQYLVTKIVTPTTLLLVKGIMLVGKILN